ncbi:F-box protein At3g07870-like [Aegilops tauschii subsp. strangulata]|uniref:F-box protein At3g07870-like n=1 Tax=Aegilops tauschii subsp. strangulata TaxID=200361 RepID=UPI00098ADAB9|nr:F-box protein At3g07870-like [Aegilops tauschii subsp. strangulata]
MITVAVRNRSPQIGETYQKLDSSAAGFKAMVYAVPTDVLADILARLPTNARRRVRLVCRLWRNLVDEWAPVDMRRRDKILVVESWGFREVVHVLSPEGSRAELWRELDVATACLYRRMNVVGTCNGIVCLCDDREPGGAITLVNPSTGEELCLPRLPTTSSSVELRLSLVRKSWHLQYAFARHPETGRYTVVHVPWSYERFWEPGMVHVFTLGEALWRDVHAGPDAKCSPGLSSLAIIDATLYWLTEDTDGKIRSFDLDHDRVTCIGPLPVPAKSSCCRLAKVHGMLGVAVDGDGGSTAVWVLEMDERWTLWFLMEAHGPRQLAMPHFAHGDCILTQGRRNENYYLHRHKTQTGAGQVLQIGQKDGEEVTRLEHDIYRTFAYVETKEQLSVYSAALVTQRRRNQCTIV